MLRLLATSLNLHSPCHAVQHALHSCRSHRKLRHTCHHNCWRGTAASVTQTPLCLTRPTLVTAATCGQHQRVHCCRCHLHRPATPAVLSHARPTPAASCCCQAASTTTHARCCCSLSPPTLSCSPCLGCSNVRARKDSPSALPALACTACAWAPLCYQMQLLS